MAPKTKQKAVQSRQKKHKPLVSSTSSKSPSLEDLARKEIWQAEIQALTAQKPASIEEAISILIDRVIAKMNVPQMARGEATEFLQLLFATDPGLKDMVRGALKL